MKTEVDIDQEDSLHVTIRDLISRATLAHESGDLQSYHHLVGSIADRLIVEGPKEIAEPAISGRAAEIKEILHGSWLDVAGLCALTGLNPNRIHIALTTLRNRGYKVKSKNFKRYHIEP